MDYALKRSNIRYIIDLEVNVTSTTNPPFSCKVRDYCLSGMFLNTPGGPNGTSVKLTNGQTVTIDFQAEGQKRQRISAQIVNVSSAGYGIKFQEASDEALNALLAIAALQQAKREESPVLAGDWQSEGRAGLQLLLKDTLQRHIISLYSDFHESAVDTIFERASHPKSHNEQNQLFEALDLLNKQRHPFFQRVSSEIIANFDACASGKPLPMNFGPDTAVPQRAGELTLMDDRDFESWLWANATVATLEEQYSEEIFALNKRLSLLQGRTIGNQESPFAAPPICHTFQSLIAELPIEEIPRGLIISTFQELIPAHFGGLVNDVNDYLVERGILPEVKRDIQIKLNASSSMGASAHATRPSPTATHDTHAPVHNAPPAQAAPAQAAPHGGSVATTAPPSTAEYSAPSAGLAQVRELMRSTKQSAPESAGGAASTPPTGWYSPQELNSALSNIEGSLSTIRENRDKGQSILEQLKESLARMGGTPNRAIPVAQEESLEVIDNLIGSVQHDPVIPETVRPWYNELEVPLLKTALKDETLLENRDHPATHFLNRLDLIGKTLSPQGGERTQAVRNEINSLIEQVKDKSAEDEPAFDQALTRLEDLHDSMRRQYESSVSELTRRCDSEYRLEQKRNELIALLDDHFGGRMLPIIVFEIMDAGWKNLLLRSYIREGVEGRIFRRFLEVLEQLIARLTGDHSRVDGNPWPEQTILQLIPRGLNQVPVHEENIKRLMSKLEPQLAMAAIDPGAIALKQMARIGEATEERRKRNIVERITRLKVTPERWSKADDSVRSMSAGDMITLTDKSGEKHSHRLVWVAGDHSRYVFVDGEGRLSNDIPKEDLTTLLLGNNAAILEGWDVPLMDRATYSMLLSIHKKLLHQTNYDTLTDLHNRRAFELELDKTLERSRIDKTKNILCYLDLDHFSLVNTMCGHGEGDRLLKECAELLRQHTTPQSLIGRMGGDEFALLMPDLSRTEGLMAVRKVQQAMHAHKFQCKTNSYRLAASFGLTEFNEISEDSSHLLASVDNACRMAKEGGRDRIEILHETNVELDRRHELIQLVGQMREAMDNHQLQLVCQRILPISEANIKQSPYYEILLRVQDEKGQPISHAEFIQAAEMFNRSVEVDRWVATTIIDWMEQRLGIGKAIPILSVNLSGRSVNNKEFMDAIATRIIKSTIPRNHLCFEITETAAIGDMGQATHFINRIKRLGCSFSLDDFGTGLSSYSYLKALPVDYIKIDGSFVRNCHNEPRDLAVIKSINEIGHAMGKKTVAEFVENEEILKRLHEIGVDYAQGYGIEKPIPLSQLN